MGARATWGLLGVAVAAVVASAAVPFWNWHPDEATYVQIALESRAAGAWLDATYFGAPNFFKPPLLYAAMRAAWAVLGDTVLAARLPGLACLLLCAALVFRWARREAGPRAGLVAAVTVLLSPLALRFGHLAMMDVPLAACFLGAAVVGREVRSGASGPRPAALLALATAVTVLLKGPALLPLLLAAFALEAGRQAVRPTWLLALATGTLAGCAWLFISYQRHGQAFVSAFFFKENLGKLGQAWTPLHVLALLVGLVLAALPYRVWPLVLFGRGARAAPAFARWFPVVALAFYAVPSVTFTQYMVCALPAVALGVGVVALRTPPWAIAAHVAAACALLLGGAALTRATTSAPPFACRQLEVVDDKPGFYWLWLRRPDGAAATCTLRKGPCDGAGARVTVPKPAVSAEDLLGALRTGSLAPLELPLCLSR